MATATSGARSRRAGANEGVFNEAGARLGRPRFIAHARTAHGVGRRPRPAGLSAWLTTATTSTPFVLNFIWASASRPGTANAGDPKKTTRSRFAKARSPVGYAGSPARG